MRGILVAYLDDAATADDDDVGVVTIASWHMNKRAPA